MALTEITCEAYPQNKIKYSGWLNEAQFFHGKKYQSIIYFPVGTCFEKPFLPTWPSAKSHNLHLNSVYALENYQPSFFTVGAYEIIWSTFHIESPRLTINRQAPSINLPGLHQRPSSRIRRLISSMLFRISSRIFWVIALDLCSAGMTDILFARLWCSLFTGEWVSVVYIHVHCTNRERLGKFTGKIIIYCFKKSDLLQKHWYRLNRSILCNTETACYSVSSGLGHSMLRENPHSPKQAFVLSVHLTHKA